ncbi:MAG: radical SAM/SPASM domain-containing protein [bacterium]|nr:radical SAM/SPASM domain-containing protein [bacterium]
MVDERHFINQGRSGSEAERVAYMLENMQANKAYRYAKERTGGDPDGRLLEEYRERFRSYRLGWHGNPKYAIERKLHHEAFRAEGFPPMSVDIETASVCDLACPHCYRQWIATPDKLMREKLYNRIIDQCAELGVPSVKLNWRGEPILHPRLPQFVDYAKRAGILETIINTDAVTLDEKKSRALIEAGLDLLIYSFDGGTKETYEQMRPGRFKENHFETVYGNIRRFDDIRQEMRAVLPRTKIQMVLTAETFREQDAFVALFEDCVDDVSALAYTERGGKLPDLDEETRCVLGDFLHKEGISESAAYYRDIQGTLYVSSGRLPCEQPYQRLVVTYDGRVCMCCYDWGAEHPIGYVDSEAFEDEDRQHEVVVEKARSGERGFELLSNVRMPKRYVNLPRKVETLPEIWYGDLVNEVRQKHVEDLMEEVPVCRRCPSLETYRWVGVDLQYEPTSG